MMAFPELVSVPVFQRGSLQPITTGSLLPSAKDWRWKSRRRGGRPRITPELRGLIRRLAQENTGWGAPRIHGELQKLGFILSERTVARYLSRTQRSQEMAHISSQPPRGHRRLRLLHRSDREFPSVVLF